MTQQFSDEQVMSFMDAALKADPEHPERFASIVRSGAIPRHQRIRVARSLMSDAEREMVRAQNDMLRLQAERDAMLYRPLWGAARTPAATLEAKYALAANMRAWFSEKDRTPEMYDIADELLRAEPFAIAAHIQTLIEEAGAQLPPNAVLQESDLPCPQGVITGIRKFADGADALFWTGIGSDMENPERQDEYGGVGIFEYREDEKPWFAYIWRAGETLDGEGRVPHDRISREHILAVGQFFAAFCYFVKQRIFTTSPQRADRAGRKRALREGYDPEEAVQVVELRATHQQHDSDAEHRSVEWQSRWIVRGHWRQQPYGPGRTLVHPIWISPYVKGPDDKPVAVRTRLFEVAR